MTRVALADPPQSPRDTPAATARFVELRLALSPGAAQHLTEARVRRLVEIELGDYAVLAPGTSGPLGDHVAYVWIDEPAAERLVIEVRVADRPVARRELNLRGLPGDVAARFAVVAAAEMVRAQTQPLPKPRKPPPPRKLTPEELEYAARPLPTIALHAAFDATWLPAAHGALVGPALGAAFRFRRVEESLFARAVVGDTDPGATRMLEAGLGATYRFWIAPAFRVALGGEAALDAVHLGDATRTDGLRSELDSWTARAGGVVAGELRLTRGAWLGLGLHPGALLRPVPFDTLTTSGALRGAALGVSLALTLETAPAAPTSP